MYCQGQDTFKISKDLHLENRLKLCNALKQDSSFINNSLVLLKGGEEINQYSADTTYLFRQEDYFFWTFGVREPDFYGAIILNEKCTSVLFAPKLPDSFEIWNGKISSLDEIKTQQKVDEVLYVDAYGKNTDSGLFASSADIEEKMEKYSVDKDTLFPIISECRVFKSSAEVDVMRYANKISVDAHKAVMRDLSVGMMEYQLESVFQHSVYFRGGSRTLAYTPIAACGPRSAVLHYGHAGHPNNQEIKDGQFCLFDMGAEYYGYASDITITIPSNRKFSANQEIIYNAVLNASRSVIEKLTPGVSWISMHLLAQKIIVSSLKDAGILRGDVDEMLKMDMGSIFMPHGLGHLIGLNVHDVGGHNNVKEEDVNTGKKFHLRCSRILEANMVITVEPGCYFIDKLISPAFEKPEIAKFINQEKIKDFLNIGGVRIEDNLLITPNGYELLSKDLPRTVKEIEHFMMNLTV